MKRKRIDNAIERRIAIGMVVSDEVMREIDAIWNPDLIRVPYVRRVGEWCVEYWRKYGTAPRKDIQAIYLSAVRKGGMDEDTAELVGDFLEDLSEEAMAEPINAAALMDEVHERFTEASLQNLSQDITAHLARGSTSEAQEMVTTFRLPPRVGRCGTDPYADEELAQRAFETRVEPLFKFRGAFGHMVNLQLVAGGFLGIMGKHKIGKTAFLTEYAYRARRHHLNVAFFGLGDETREDQFLRFAIRLTGRSHLAEYCQPCWVPVIDCLRNQQDECSNPARMCRCGVGDAKHPKDADPDYRPCNLCAKRYPAKWKPAVWYILKPEVEPLTWRAAMDAGEKFNKHFHGRLRMECFPNCSVNVGDLESVLDRWKQDDGFVPQVIVGDYADLLTAERGQASESLRDRIHGNWSALRRMSQTRHALTIFGTQSDAESFDAFLVRAKHFTDDRRKLDEVTGMQGLSQTDAEKRKKFLRTNWVALRHGRNDPTEMVVLLQDLDHGKPITGSFRYVRKDKKQEDG
jgi:hypothetical protein